MSSRTPWFSFLIPGTPRPPPTSHRLSHRSPLRSADSTAAPEGQTIFDFGKRARGDVNGNLGRVYPQREAVSASVTQGKVAVHSPHPTGARCAPSLPSKTENGEAGETGRERVPEVKPAPGLSLRAQKPEDPAPIRRPPSSKGARGHPRGGRSWVKTGSKMDSKPSGSHREF